MNILLYVLIAGLLASLGFLGGFFYRKYLTDSHLESLESLGKKILDEARKEAEGIKKEARLQAKDQLYQMKQDFDKETQERRQEMNLLERRLLQKEEHLEKKVTLLDERDVEQNKKQKILLHQEKELAEKSSHYTKLVNEQNARLEQLAGMNAMEAKDLLLKTLER